MAMGSLPLLSALALVQVAGPTVLLEATAAWAMFGLLGTVVVAWLVLAVVGLVLLLELAQPHRRVC